MLAMPSATSLLEVWETGEREHAIDRALTLLQAFTGEPRAWLASLGLHRRDALLVRSRILAFGPLLSGVAVCSSCACEVEVELQLRAPGDDALCDVGSLEVRGQTIAFRVPNSYDLAEIATSGDASAGAAVLRSRCIGGGEPLDEETLAKAERALETLCAPATIEIATTCPACDMPLAPVVDMASILWRELTAYARRLLDDVDALATKYGWSERAILALPDVRRQRYLEGTW